MAKASPALVNFNSGEWSAHMEGRVDIDRYRNACRRMRNFVGLVQGPAQKRAGTPFVASAKHGNKKTWLAPFRFSEAQAYVLEFGDQYVRYYTDRAQLLSGPSTPYETATPYLEADLTGPDGAFALWTAQVADVVYIFNRAYAPRKLVRLTPSTWSMATAELRGGPFKDVDPDNPVTVYASAATGAVTLTASGATFQAGHVGSLFYLERKLVDTVPQWVNAQSVTSGDLRQSDGKYYQAMNTATTGQTKPTHSIGTVSDGTVSWQYLHAGFGIAKITAYSSPTSVSATVVSRLPGDVVSSGNATTRWAHAKYSDVEGWPTHGAFWNERLVLARDQEIDMSVVGDYEDFATTDAGVVTAEMAIRRQLPTGDSIRWLATPDALMIGTAGGEYLIDAINSQEALGPANIQARQQGADGGRAVRPAVVGGAVLFVQAAGRKLRESAYTFERDKYTSADRTVLADHMTVSGIVDLAYQQEPHSIVWAALASGRLLGYTTNEEQEVRGWHRHPLGGAGKVRALASIPAPDGNGDDLWMVVERVINGTTVQYIEYLSRPYEAGDRQHSSFYVDSGLSLVNTVNATLTPGTGAMTKGATGVPMTAGSSVFSAGDVGRFIHFDWSTADEDGDAIHQRAVAEITAYSSGTSVDVTILSPWPDTAIIPALGWRLTVTTLAGLNHLEGKDVAVLADGGSHPGRTVQSGSIALARPASVVHVGLPYRGLLETMRLEAGAMDGTAQGKTKRINETVMRFASTGSARVGPDLEHLELVEFRGEGVPMNTPPPLFTGDKSVPWDGGYDTDTRLMVISDLPLPCTVVGMFPRVDTANR
ncbi:MAG: hypothetical protein KIT73_01295 [Burkholderiales bacterium]|nr:hypothetical protein [Burkholderiales bacterium]